EEKFDPTICWTGLVNIFDVVNHPTAGCCFAWTYREGGEMKSEAVLNTPPVDSPAAAVRAVFAVRTASPSR
ncbi:MAG: hypothetical protein M3Q46_10730, partial [Verrucomicrobiota bacterium]|nr:hypothetical protein [Verrucomicrobiota bacterium]